MKSQARALKRQVVAVTLVCCMAAGSAATQPTSSSTASGTDARQQLFDLEEEWTAAEDKRDAVVLRRILDERFVATLGAAKTYDRDAFIRLFAGDIDPTKSHTFTHEAVIIDGDTAVLVSTYTARGTRDGAAYTAVYRSTVTYIHRGGQWRALAEHIVRVPQAA